MDIRQYGLAVHNEPCESFSRLLDRYFAERDAAEHLKRTANDVIQACGAAEARIRRRLSARQQDMKRCAEKENYRIFGELLKANLYTVRPGSRAVTVVNYYDENGGTITIPLDPKLSAVQNAAKYFKEYKKSRTALQLLEELIAEDGRELDYLASVRDSIERCETAADLREIREELQEAGYLRRSAKKTVSKIRKNIGFREFVSPGGFRLLVGRTNQQNDTLTLRVAQKNDWWFHVKGGPGSHAVLISDGNEVPQDDLLMAAQTAAWFSKSAHSSQVAVDYTRIRHVKKPKNAKPGMVIYTDQHTVFVTPKQPEEPSGGKE